MASSKLLLCAMLFVISALNAASDENTDKDQEEVAVKAEDELPTEVEGSAEATEKPNREEQGIAEGETAREENYKKNQVDPNMDGLILLACIVGLVVFIVILRYMCCTIEQCEEKSKRSLGAREKVEHTEKEIILHGTKYKSLV